MVRNSRSRRAGIAFVGVLAAAVTAIGVAANAAPSAGPVAGPTAHAADMTMPMPSDSPSMSDMPMPTDSPTPTATTPPDSSAPVPLQSGSSRPSDGVPVFTPPPGSKVTTLTYGPTVVPGGKVGAAGQLIGAGGNSPSFGIQKPCTDCYITAIQASLVGISGKVIDLPNQVMLHHVVIARTGPGLADITCPGTVGGAQLGQRFFASGNERTLIEQAPGYGIYVSPKETWNSFTDEMNWNTNPWVTFLKVTYTWVPAAQAPQLKPVTPVWMDAAECNAYDTFDLPGTGKVESQTASWTSSISGTVVGGGGHMHAMGVNVAVVDDTTGKTICNSVASNFSAPGWTDDMGMPGISALSRCYNPADGHSIGVIHRGDHLRTIANYNTMADSDDDDVMGILVLYVDQSKS